MMHLRPIFAALATLGLLSACSPSNTTPRSSEFPPLGLSSQQTFLSTRVSTPVPQARLSASEQEARRVEAASAPIQPTRVSAAPVTASGVAGTAQQIMAQLCLPRINDFTNIRGATQQINQQLFGVAPPIDGDDYSLGGTRRGSVAPLRFTPAVDRVNQEYGCGIAVRGEDPNSIAQPIFTQLRAAGLRIGAGRDSIAGQRIYPVSGARPNLSLRVTTVRRAGQPVINMVLTHP